MLLLISGDIHPNPGPALSAPVESPGETDQYNVPAVPSGYTSPALVFLPLTSAKSPMDTLGLAQCAHPLLNPPPPSHTLIPYLHSFLYLHPLTLQIPHLHSQTTTKPYLQKLNPPPKQPRMTPPYLPNYPQLIYTYPPSALTTPSPQTQQTTSPLTQSSFHPSSPSRNNFRILQWNANGIRPRRTELLHFLSHNQYDLIFIQESHLSSDSTFRIPGYKTLQKNRL